MHAHTVIVACMTHMHITTVTRNTLRLWGESECRRCTPVFPHMHEPHMHEPPRASHHRPCCYVYAGACWPRQSERTRTRC